MKEITIVARDRIGLVADISEALAEKSVNIESVNVETAGKTAIVKIVTNEEKKAHKILSKAGFKPIDSNLAVIRMVDRPGELAKITRLLADRKINIESVFMLSKEGRETVLALKVSNLEKARKILENYL